MQNSMLQSATAIPLVHAAVIADHAAAQGAMIAVKSVFHWSKAVLVYVIDMGLSTSDRAALQAISPQVCLLKPADDVLCWLKNFSLHGDKHVSQAAYAKLQLHRILPETEKVIYLDTDILVLSDLSELFAMALGEDMVGATWTGFQAQAGRDRLGLRGRYFNSGVMLCPLDSWREACIDNTFLDWYRENYAKMKFNDQEIFNGVFDGRNMEIGKRWNVTHWEYFKGENRPGIPVDDIAILHFNGPLKHWAPDYGQQMMPNKRFDAVKRLLDILIADPHRDR